MPHIVRRLFLLGALAACDPIPPDPVPPDAPPDVQRVEVVTFKAHQNPQLDLLFVIDDSPSMIDKQVALDRAFPALMAKLAEIPGGTPDLHLGVISTDMGTKGSGVMSPGPAIGQIGNGGCASTGKGGALLTQNAAVTDAFVKLGRDNSKNFTGTLPEVFSAMARLGAGGCGFEQPLAATRAALDGHAANVGFLRESANLAVVILSDEDDCSAKDPALFGPETAELGPLQSFRCFRFGVECAEETGIVGAKTACRARQASTLVDDIAPYRDFLVGLKGGDARKVMLGAIVGDPAPVVVEPRTPPGGGSAQTALAHSCTYDTTAGTAVADPPVRIEALIKSFPGPASMVSVCNNELAPAVDAIGKTINRLVGDGCLTQAIPEPADCLVGDVRDSDPTRLIAIPPCDGAAATCYRLVDDSSACTAAPFKRLEITRAAPAADDAWTVMRCAN